MSTDASVVDMDSQNNHADFSWCQEGMRVTSDYYLAESELIRTVTKIYRYNNGFATVSTTAGQDGIGRPLVDVDSGWIHRLV